jgi:hypothetical protein
MLNDKQRTVIGHQLIPGRKPPNYKDLTTIIKGALRCDGRGYSDASNVRWKTTCICCGVQRMYTTYLFKQGRCRSCKATTAPVIVEATDQVA